MKAFFDMMHEGPHKVMLFGAACTQVTDPIAKASKHWRITQVNSLFFFVPIRVLELFFVGLFFFYHRKFVSPTRSSCASALLSVNFIFKNIYIYQNYVQNRSVDGPQIRPAVWKTFGFRKDLGAN